MKRLLVTGSRDFTDSPRLEATLAWARQELGDDTVLVHGGARGLDLMAKDVWSGWGLPTEEHPVTNAEWRIIGKSAGHRRNARMVAAGADLVIGFPVGESRGTRGCMAAAQRAGLDVREVAPSPTPA